MVKRRGGGFFTTTINPPGGIPVTQTNWRNIFLFILVIVILGVIIGVSVYYGTRPKEPSSEGQKGGGAVAPPYSKRPGRINIAEVAQAPSAGQGIIYFSQAEEQGVLCDTCTAEFNINITYTGGTPVEPQFKKVTSPSTSGVARFDYSVFIPPPSTPGQQIHTGTTPPTSMQVEVNARSMIPGTGISGGTTTFTKTLPYVA